MSAPDDSVRPPPAGATPAADDEFSFHDLDTPVEKTAAYVARAVQQGPIPTAAQVTPGGTVRFTPPAAPSGPGGGTVQHRPPPAETAPPCFLHLWVTLGAASSELDALLARFDRVVAGADPARLRVCRAFRAGDRAAFRDAFAARLPGARPRPVHRRAAEGSVPREVGAPRPRRSPQHAWGGTRHRRPLPGSPGR